MTEVPVPAKSKADNVQISNEKFKGKSIVIGWKFNGVQLSAVKFQGKSFVMLGDKVETKNKRQKQTET